MPYFVPYWKNWDSFTKGLQSVLLIMVMLLIFLLDALIKSDYKKWNRCPTRQMVLLYYLIHSSPQSSNEVSSPSLIKMIKATCRWVSTLPLTSRYISYHFSCIYAYSQLLRLQRNLRSRVLLVMLSQQERSLLALGKPKSVSDKHRPGRSMPSHHVLQLVFTLKLWLPLDSHFNLVLVVLFNS